MPTRSNLGAKDYELIASVLIESGLDRGEREGLAFEFADRLVATSDSFDPLRFINQVTGQDFTGPMVGDYSTAIRLRVEALEARRRS